jgi:hypothetical protein
MIGMENLKKGDLRRHLIFPVACWGSNPQPQSQHLRGVLLTARLFPLWKAKKKTAVTEKDRNEELTAPRRELQPMTKKMMKKRQRVNEWKKDWWNKQDFGQSHRAEEQHCSQGRH